MKIFLTFEEVGVMLGGKTPRRVRDLRRIAGVPVVRFSPPGEKGLVSGIAAEDFPKIKAVSHRRGKPPAGGWQDGRAREK